MAQPSTEVQRFRAKVTSLMENLRDLDNVLATVEDHGVDDAARQAFFASVFVVEYDITWSVFAQGVVALRAIKTARDAQKITVAKLLI